MQFYRIYVKLKNGGQATGGELQTGSPPISGTELDVPLITGRVVKARIGLPDRKHTRRAGTVVAVYADEI
ncbi:MAG: hypothetical protein WA728_25745 [Xanthobacteraceae bacterium]